jgi:hypothetical protein
LYVSTAGMVLQSNRAEIDKVRASCCPPMTSSLAFEE